MQILGIIVGKIFEKGIEFICYIMYNNIVCLEVCAKFLITIQTIVLLIMNGWKFVKQISDASLQRSPRNSVITLFRLRTFVIIRELRKAEK